MLATVLAHAGRPLAPHDLWRAWNLDPLLLLGLALAVATYLRGRRRSPASARDRRRSLCFAGGLVTIAVALVSPLDALSDVLASAHMVQHVLIMLVAAPLLALAAPFAALVRGTPAPALRMFARLRRKLRLRPAVLRHLRDPTTAWLLQVGTLWLWHASVPYDAALEHQILHGLEHATFLGTGVLFWSAVVVTSVRDASRTGFALLLVFAMAVQGVFLSALLTFAARPWYSAYATTTRAWGLDHLADQQLAGAIMWVPGGLVYVAAGLAMLVAWVRASGVEATVEHPVRVSRQPKISIAENR